VPIQEPIDGEAAETLISELANIDAAEMIVCNPEYYLLKDGRKVSPRLWLESRARRAVNYYKNAGPISFEEAKRIVEAVEHPETFWTLFSHWRAPWDEFFDRRPVPQSFPRVGRTF
jgi:hypothetical protein